ncbi:hypothetical protein GCM10010399_18520 [Dactylosporangium fulvum]
MPGRRRPGTGFPVPYDHAPARGASRVVRGAHAATLIGLQTVLSPLRATLSRTTRLAPRAGA